MIGAHSKLPILQALQDPEMLYAMDPGQWDLFLRLARRANLLSRFSLTIRDEGGLERVPEAVRKHLLAECKLAEQQQRVIEWELVCLRRALASVNLPLILLKGAAYVAAGLPPARGRRFSDVDILIPKERLEIAEKALFLHGWFAEKQDPYDQQYYRRWMHELPPLRHARRRTVLDVHHTIVPLTMRLNPDPAKLIASTVAAGCDPGIRVLAPADMVLHNAAHLFLDGEFSSALRDLADLDLLLADFSTLPGFWDELEERSIEMELTRPMYYAVRYLQRSFNTAIPEAFTSALERHAPGKIVSRLMEPLLDRAVTVHHPASDDAFSGLARFLLYIRGHYLRMPIYLLLPHLLRKSLRSDG